MEINVGLFLDIDGTLATDECFEKTEPKFGRNLYKWNQNCVNVLNQIIIESDLEIILSSDWRKYFTKDQLNEIFEWNNVIKSPIAITDNDKYKMSSNLEIDRIHQIGRFLQNNSIKKWVAVDDLNLKSDIVKNFVWVGGEYGISEVGVKEKIISFLK